MTPKDASMRPQPTGLCILLDHLIARAGWCFTCAKEAKLRG